MATDDRTETRITTGWHRHGAAWAAAVRGRRIASRAAVTDQALIDAILEERPTRLLDLGCGEGWLARSLAPMGIAVTGIDASAPLVDAARRAGGGDFRVADYADLPADLGIFDLAVSNFALLGRDPVEQLLATLPQFLRPAGRLLIQTLHPLAASDRPYVDGWREDSWAAFSDAVADPPPWYFRTLGSWVRLLSRHQWRLRELREPAAAGTVRPVSVLFIAQPVIAQPD